MKFKTFMGILVTLVCTFIFGMSITMVGFRLSLGWLCAAIWALNYTIETTKNDDD